MPGPLALDGLWPLSPASFKGPFLGKRVKNLLAVPLLVPGLVYIRPPPQGDKPDSIKPSLRRRGRAGSLEPVGSLSSMGPTKRTKMGLEVVMSSHNM